MKIYIKFLLGIIIEKSKNKQLDCIPEVLQTLIQASKNLGIGNYNNSEYHEEEFEECLENIHSAIGKMIMNKHQILKEILPFEHQGQLLDFNSILKIWLGKLPLTIDILEAFDHHEKFFLFLVTDEKIILGAEEENSALLFERLLVFFENKESVFSFKGEIIFQSYLLGAKNSQLNHPKLHQMFESMESNKKAEINEYLQNSNLKAEGNDNLSDDSEFDFDEDDNGDEEEEEEIIN